MKHSRNSFLKAIAPATVLALSLAACSADTDDAQTGATDGADSTQVEDSAGQETDSGETATGDESGDDAVSGTDDTGEDSADIATTDHGADLATTVFAITWTDAVAAAQQNFDGGMTDIELEWDRTRYAYKVTLVSGTEEYDIKVDADTGELYDEEIERLDDEDAREAEQEIVDINTVISVEDAIATALENASGTVIEWSLEGDDEHDPRYYVDIATSDQGDVEVKIDAISGAFIELDD